MKNTIKAMILGMLSAVFLACAGNTLCAAPDPPDPDPQEDDTSSQWDSVTEGVWQDPVTGDFHFKSVDKKRSSETFYRTQGFTIADAYQNADGSIVETGIGEFNWPLDDPRNDYSERELGNGLIETEWVIPYDIVMEQIKETSPEWYDKVMSPEGAVYLKLDAIIAVHDATLGWSGGFNDLLNNWEGELWDKYNMEELYNLYGWDSSYFDNHFDQALVIAAGPLSEDTTLEDLLEQGLDEETARQLLEELEKNKLQSIHSSPEEYADFRKTIGKQEPYYATYNYSTSGQFDLGDGIPTSESVTNGYEADEWYGYAMMYRRKPVTRTWTFSGNISWDDYYEYEDEFQQLQKIPFTMNKWCQYTVQRTVRYWYVAGSNIYTLDSIRTENDVFPGHERYYYLRQDTTRITCTVNGRDMRTVSEFTASTWLPDDDYHIDWPEGIDHLIYVKGSSESDAQAKFGAEAEKRVPRSEDIVVRNDDLAVNGHEYMNGSDYLYSEFAEEEGSDRSFYSIQEDDYGKETDEKSGLIPADTANGEYFTTITAFYRQKILGTDRIGNHEKRPDNSSLSERIKAGYLDQEPVVVHTPTVSPVIVADPDTGEELSPEAQKTQLVTGAVNPDVDYQLLLDGTYTIKFIPETHFEHMGYDAAELTQDMYSKYCRFKQAAFPFTVQLDGDIYEPDGNTVDDKGDPKKPGYTQWIDLPDFTIDDFYIPSWATEGSYVILFRVAPENVVDQHGVNHIDDEEWLKNATLNGAPLYNYVSTYSINVQVSGRIYGFQINGINDLDRFHDTGTNTTRWENFGLASYFPFCKYYEEKRTGTRNRLGGPFVRYSVDGTLTNSWNIRNTLPFSVGRSFKFDKDPRDTSLTTDGTLVKGNSFTFSLRTIANLWSDEKNKDYLVIRPTFRWVSSDGTQTSDVDLYYNTPSEDGNEELLYVEYGSDLDRSVYHRTSIGDIRNDGSYYYPDASIDRTIPQDDAEYSKDKRNEYMWRSGESTARETFSNANRYIMKTPECYCMSRIVMTRDLRLLSGNLEQLERNLDKEGAALEYLTDRKTTDGGLYDVTENSNPEYWDKHRMSMQEWFGEYWIPSQLYVTKEHFMADADGDGVEEEYDDIYSYMEKHGYIEGNEDFFLNDGYLVLNFNITSYNEGVQHLAYYAGNQDSIDQWKVEGAPDTVKAGDPNIHTDIEIPVQSGDVAVIDLERDIRDRMYVGFNRIN